MRASFLVFSNPESPEKEDEYNDWYNNTHIPAILKLDGYVGASRWKLSAARPAADALAERQYLAIYELETDDLPGAFERLQRANAAGDLGSGVGILSTPTMVAAFELISEFEG
jgi:hypothetical protein